MSSWRSRAVNLFLRRTFKRRLERLTGASRAEIRRSRRRVERTGTLSPPIRGTAVEALGGNEPKGEWVRAPNIASVGSILYLHGGAYAVGSPAAFREFASRLSCECRAQVLSLDYRLAPENPFPAALEDAVSAWRFLLDSGTKSGCSAVVGDSAGGGLVLALLLSLRDRGEPLPAAAVCFSPWTDLTVSGPSTVDNAETDPFLVAHLLAPVAAAYAAGQEIRNPLISPLFGDLTGLPPLMIHVGGTEILLSDSTRFAEKATAAGVDVTLRCWEDAAHVFHLLARFLPEGREAIRETGRFIQSHWASYPRNPKRPLEQSIPP